MYSDMNKINYFISFKINLLFINNPCRQSICISCKSIRSYLARETNCDIGRVNLFIDIFTL